MITQKEEEKLYILSDTELYPQAVEFMRGIARKLPATQINGLLNVSLGNNSYDQLKRFADSQYKRSTWKPGERHIPDFYRRLTLKFKDLEKYALTILNLRTEKASAAEQEEMKMAVAREFIQHLLAENDYMIGTQAFQAADSNRGRASNQESVRDGQRGSWPTRGGTRQ